MSDIHGKIELLKENLEKISFSQSNDDKLILCGDYIEHSWENATDSFQYIMDIQNHYGQDKVMVLPGNHEIDWIYQSEEASYPQNIRYCSWINSLPLFYEQNNIVFVHAGIDEEIQDLWRYGTPEEFFTHKFPPDTGIWSQNMDIVAGHVGVMNDYLGGPNHGACIYYDNANHFYIDGTTERTGILPILEYDIENNIYYAWDEDGDRYPIAIKQN